MNGEGEKGEEDLAEGEEERITYFSVIPSCVTNLGQAVSPTRFINTTQTFNWISRSSNMAIIESTVKSCYYIIFHPLLCFSISLSLLTFFFSFFAL